MRSPHTWNRRDFNVTSNGFFTVLREAGWFASPRLPAGLRFTRPARTTSTTQGELAIEPQVQLQTIEPVKHDRPLMRAALIVLAAGTVTSLLLRWLMFPR
jgi:hypothetical protein